MYSRFTGNQEFCQRTVMRCSTIKSQAKVLDYAAKSFWGRGRRGGGGGRNERRIRSAGPAQETAGHEPLVADDSSKRDV